MLVGNGTGGPVAWDTPLARGSTIAGEATAGVAPVAQLQPEVRVGANTFGATRNPLLWLEPWSGSGVIAGRLVDPDGRAWQGVTVTLIDKDGALLNTWTYLDDPDHLIRPDRGWARTSSSARWLKGAIRCLSSYRGRSTGSRSRCAMAK